MAQGGMVYSKYMRSKMAEVMVSKMAFSVSLHCTGPQVC